MYQGDPVPGAEDLRTPMSDSLELERLIRGQISGFMVPSFILDSAQGGKRLVSHVEEYDRHLGRSTMTVPGLKGEPTQIEYWDPLWSLSEEGRNDIIRLHNTRGEKSV